VDVEKNKTKNIRKERVTEREKEKRTNSVLKRPVSSKTRPDPTTTPSGLGCPSHR